MSEKNYSQKENLSQGSSGFSSKEKNVGMAVIAYILFLFLF